MLTNFTDLFSFKRLRNWVKLFTAKVYRPIPFGSSVLSWIERKGEIFSTGFLKICCPSTLSSINRTEKLKRNIEAFKLIAKGLS
jgi:hypothetical protein